MEAILYRLKKEKAKKRISDAIVKTESKKDYQRALSVWLCCFSEEFKQKLTDTKIAEILGMSRGEVSRIHTLFCKTGCNAFNTKHRGGRREKRCNIKLEEEIKFLTLFFTRYKEVTPRLIKDFYVKRFDRARVSYSTLYRLIKRHEDTLKKLYNPKVITTDSHGNEIIISI